MKKNTVRVCVALLGVLLGTTTALSLSRALTPVQILIGGERCPEKEPLITCCKAHNGKSHSDCTECCARTFDQFNPATSDNYYHCTDSCKDVPNSVEDTPVSVILDPVTLEPVTLVPITGTFDYTP